VNFTYVAKTRDGEEVAGFQAGSSLDDAVSRLHAQGLSILHVAEDRSAGSRTSWGKKVMSATFGRASTRDLALFNRQFSTVLEAGIPLVRGLRGLAADTSSRILSRSVLDVSRRIEQGENLSDAMAQHPEAFDDMYLSMVRAGERAGTLDKIVEQMAVYLEKMDAIKTKVRSAMAYPTFVLLFAISMTLVLLIWIVPKFAEIYAEFGQALPGLTQTIINVSNMIRDNALLVVAGVLALLILMWMWGRTAAGRYVFDSFKIKVPVFGPIVRKAVMSRFARTFGVLLSSGLPILDALQLVRGAAGNAVVSSAIGKVKNSVAAGQGITESFRATGKFPEMVLQLMATGEESGDLDNMLLKSSDFYDRQVEASVQGLASLIEPFMIILVGGIVGIIVVSMFLPIFYLGEAVMRGGYNY
jgi:type IV pilus assembly protein PilC